MKDEALLYLNDYLTNPKIIDWNSDEAIEIPSWWKSALSSSNKIKEVISEWNKFNDVLPQTVAYISKNLKMVELMEHEKGYALLYGIECEGELYYFEGRNPLNSQPSEIIEGKVDALPERLKAFYREFHNGWFYVADESGGPYPLETIFFLSDYEWGILDDIKNVEINLNATVAIFGNGGGGYLCLSADSNYAEDNAIVWWDDEPPDLSQHFWSVLDEWMYVGLSEG